MQNFRTITVKNDSEKFINSLDKNTLLVYSRTSLDKVQFKNKDVCKYNWRKLSKDVNVINKEIKKLNCINRVVSFGGGSAIDIAKYISDKLDIEHICIPTMLSTNSYATSNVALIRNNKKETIPVKNINKIILDNNLLIKSKNENLYGLADVLSIYTALYDWKIANEDIDEIIDNKIYLRAEKLLHKALNLIANNSFETIILKNELLYEIIGEAGYITDLYGSGRPESGSEHILAKQIEEMIDIPHGVAVSIGIIIMSKAQNRVNMDIINGLQKIKVIDKTKKYVIDSKIIKIAIEKIEPRKDRYSVINRNINKDNLWRYYDYYK